MPTETELKLRVESHEPVRRKLKAVGASLIETVLETNHIYDRPDGSLRGRGCGLRLRSIVPRDGSAGRTTLTFKGPRLASAMKSREELEIGVDDAETAARMLEQLGFVSMLRYQKRRDSWRVGGCRVELDEPPRIGLFVEIEGPHEEAIRAVQWRLGLQKLKPVPTSYVGMLVAYCDANGITDRTLTLAGGA